MPTAADPGLLAEGAALTRSSMFSAAACNTTDDQQILIGCIQGITNCLPESVVYRTKQCEVAPKVNVKQLIL